MIPIDLNLTFYVHARNCKGFGKNLASREQRQVKKEPNLEFYYIFITKYLTKYYNTVKHIKHFLFIVSSTDIT